MPTQRHRELPSTWTPAEVEGALYEQWVAAGCFTADATSDKPPYTIVIPPPNVTGSLHVGHAFEHSLIDALIRRRRMQGYNTLWLPGMDHASIPVHRLVEKQLKARGPPPPRTGPGGVRRPRVAVEGRVRRQDPGPDAQARRQR